MHTGRLTIRGGRSVPISLPSEPQEAPLKDLVKINKVGRGEGRAPFRGKGSAGILERIKPVSAFGIRKNSRASYDGG